MLSGDWLAFGQGIAFSMKDIYKNKTHSEFVKKALMKPSTTQMPKKNQILANIEQKVSSDNSRIKS
jgi:hypothetical protein